VALATWFFQEPEYQALAARHFDSLTAENEMKWDAIEPDPGRFTFEAGDRLVAFAEQHGMRVRGHTLVWHKQLPAWVKTLPKDELEGAMLRHVRATVEHWKGRIAQWDVVNEAIDKAGQLRDDSPFTALGPGYLADAFRAAHTADPQALLFYNEWDIEAEDWPKTEGAYQLVKQLKESGVPIHGIGLQMHLDPRNWPDADEMRRNLARFAELGLLIELTEIDVPLGEIPGTREEKLARQRELAQGVVRACLSVPACSGMTFWGLTDKHSWLASPEWAARRGTGPHLALPFDENYQPKPMYTGILDALAGR
jgi:endo-1,4-beta-xylanase